jgi:hypothetical protein
MPDPASRGERRGEDLERLEQLDDGEVVGVRPCEQVGQVPEVVRPVDDVDPGARSATVAPSFCARQPPTTIVRSRPSSRRASFTPFRCPSVP